MGEEAWSAQWNSSLGAHLSSPLHVRASCSVPPVQRNFYFGKLREIEILSQDDEDAVAAGTATADLPEVADFKKKVLSILYATDANEEFQVPEDAANGAAADGAEEQPAADGEEGLLGEEELA